MDSIIQLILQTPSDFSAVGVALFILRLVVSFFMLKIHGLPKLMNFKEELLRIEDPFSMGAKNVLIVTVFLEVVGSVFIIFGLFTRPLSFAIASTMFVAGFVVHRDWSLEKRQFIFLYLLIYFVLGIAGGGVLSVDSWLLF